MGHLQMYEQELREQIAHNFQVRTQHQALQHPQQRLPAGPVGPGPRSSGPGSAPHLRAFSLAVDQAGGARALNSNPVAGSRVVASPSRLLQPRGGGGFLQGHPPPQVVGNSVGGGPPSETHPLARRAVAFAPPPGGVSAKQRLGINVAGAAAHNGVPNAAAGAIADGGSGGLRKRRLEEEPSSTSTLAGNAAARGAAHLRSKKLQTATTLPEGGRAAGNVAPPLKAGDPGFQAPKTLEEIRAEKQRKAAAAGGGGSGGASLANKAKTGRLAAPVKAAAAVPAPAVRESGKKEKVGEKPLGAMLDALASKARMEGAGRFAKGGAGGVGSVAGEGVAGPPSQSSKNKTLDSGTSAAEASNAAGFRGPKSLEEIRKEKMALMKPEGEGNSSSVSQQAQNPRRRILHKPAILPSPSSLPAAAPKRPPILASPARAAILPAPVKRPGILSTPSVLGPHRTSTSTETANVRPQVVRNNSNKAGNGILGQQQQRPSTTGVPAVAPIATGKEPAEEQSSVEANLPADDDRGAKQDKPNAVQETSGEGDRGGDEEEPPPTEEDQGVEEGGFAEGEEGGEVDEVLYGEEDELVDEDEVYGDDDEDYDEDDDLAEKIEGF